MVAPLPVRETLVPTAYIEQRCNLTTGQLFFPHSLQHRKLELGAVVRIGLLAKPRLSMLTILGHPATEKCDVYPMLAGQSWEPKFF